MKRRYLLKGFWQKEYDEVTEGQYRTAEKIAGKFEGGGITTLFEYAGVSGKVEFELEESDLQDLEEMKKNENYVIEYASARIQQIQATILSEKERIRKDKKG